MNRQLMVTALLIAVIFLGFGIVIPVLPELITQAGAREFHLGLLLSVYSLLGFIVSPVWGGWSDRVGRKPIMMAGLSGFSLSFFLLAIAGDQLWLMYLSRILGGIFSGATTACAVAYVADITTEETRTKGMALVGMSIGLGFTFGPAIGGLLSGFGLSIPFYAASVLSIAAVWIAYRFIREARVPGEKSRSGGTASRWSAFSGSVKYLYVLAFFVTFSLAGLEGTLQFFQAKRFGATPFDIGIMFFFCGLAGALIQGGVVRRLADKGKEPMFIVTGLLLSALGFFSLLFSKGFWDATLYLCIFGIGNSLVRPCVTSLITQKSTASYGVASGLSSSMDSLGRIAGPALGTFAFGLHENSPFLIGGVLSILAIGLLIRFQMTGEAVPPQGALKLDKLPDN
jgi:MFS family permease